MSRSTVRVIADLIAFPDKVEETKNMLLGLVKPTRQEPGCIQYDLLQDETCPNSFTFVEEWESHAALETHLNSAHIQAAISRLPELIAEGPIIRRYLLLS
uniref:Antibiotic biosynthesis monooxygenase n=1 Tax=Cyanothece sp. (strain PCC 7425 / ATCC 29141) TaxID=395961 RepID=B8HSM4_CYAP4